MVIAHNMMAMNAQRQFNIVGNSKKKSTEKLSSGYRINRAADDATGLAISEKMRRQIRGLNQGANNTMDGISLLQVADGALAEVHDMLHRVTVLSVQSANGTNTDSDREAIQQEINQIMSEINRISDTTEFNERLLFGGSNTTIIEDRNQILSNLVNKTYPASINDVELPDGTIMDKNTVNFTLNLMSDIAKGYEIFSNGYSLSNNPTRFQSLWSEMNQNLISSASRPYYISNINDAQMKISMYFNGSSLNLSDLMTSYNNAATSAHGSEYYRVCSMAPFSQAVVQHSSSRFNDYLGWQKNGLSIVGDPTFYDVMFANQGSDNESIINGIVDGYKYIFGIKFKDEAYESDQLWIQSGAEAGDGMFITIGNMNTSILSVNGLDVTTADGASRAIDAAGKATKMISALRSNIGAQQNRLEHTYKNVTNIAENTTTAESRIRDTDIAKEMVEFSKQNILEQVGQSMMAQANQRNQSVLSLLQ